MAFLEKKTKQVFPKGKEVRIITDQENGYIVALGDSCEFVYQTAQKKMKGSLTVAGKVAKEVIQAIIADEDFFYPYTKTGEDEIDATEWTNAKTVYSIKRSHINTVIHAAGTAWLKPVFHGVAALSNYGICACDSRRLTAVKLPEEERPSEDYIVPLYFLKQTKSDVKIVKSKATWYAESDGVYTRLIDGQFPNITQVIPNSFEGSISIDMEKLGKIVKATEKPSHKVIFDCESEETSISNETFIKDVFTKSKEDFDMKVAFNSVYVQDAMKNCNSNTLHLTGSKSPACVINDNVTAVIMPIQLKGESE